MNKYIYSLIGLLFVAGVAWLIITPGKPGKLDSFAQCIKQSGAEFYGAFWCPHCQAQKARFGKSAKLLPYVECSTPDGKDQLSVCKDKGVTTYPTWFFPVANSTSTEKVTGEVELEDLATRTSCVLPQ
ncbi:MAG: thioredoxin domain-containing protein [Nitrospira sp.]